MLPSNKLRRHGWKAFVFASIFALAVLVSSPTFSGQGGQLSHRPHSGRQLLSSSEKDPCAPLSANVTSRSLLCDLLEQYPNRDALSFQQIKDGGFVLYILGALYMFLALAIVCDEFFVPCLEIISEKLNLSNDVAGATLMAAGGSAPELFTSFIGTFSNSSVGFGTIVGSAVFNVLFVIAMCTLYSKETLVLTWWPLFRDSTYYATVLCLLAWFFINKKSAKHECEDGTDNCLTIELYEAIILLIFYCGYVYLMSVHEKILDKIQRCRGKTETKIVPIEKPSTQELDTPGKSESDTPVNSDRSSHGDDITKVTSVNRVDIYVAPNANFRVPATFRAGLLQIIMKDNGVLETAGIHVVHRIQGDALATFEQLDTDKSGWIEHDEMKALLKTLNCATDDQFVSDIMKELDTDGDGKVNFDEFQTWYVRSENRILAELDATFKQIDVDNSDDLDKGEVMQLLQEMNRSATTEELTDIVDGIFKALLGASKVERAITRPEFIEWYQKSTLFEEKKKAVQQQADEADGYDLEWPEGCRARVLFIILFPVTVTLYYSFFFLRPSLGASRRKLRWGVLGFAISILWIGLYSYLMVWWVEVAGASFEIPAVVMGLVFLAAGTSVPDLLSSVIVAKNGQGDMAVSSSLGSNIFDVCMGLPLPWLFYNISLGRAVEVEGDGIAVSIFILVAMLASVILVVALSGWRMTKKLGATMLVLYVIFVAQDLIQWQMRARKERS